MPKADDSNTLLEGEELNRLADALEKESATWVQDYDISDPPKYPTRAYRARHEEEKRKARCLWDNAVAAGGVLLRLLDAGAFDHNTRTKNALGQMRAEMNRARRDNEAPYYTPGRKRPAFGGSQPWSEDVHEMFLVKLVEGFCKLWAKSYDDGRAFVRVRVPVSEKAALQTRMLRALSQELKRKHPA